MPSSCCVRSKEQHQYENNWVEQSCYLNHLVYLRRSKAICGYVSGDTFQEQFLNDQKHGIGADIFADGTRVEESWQNDEYQEQK